MTHANVEAKKEPPRLQRDGSTSTTWKGTKMPYNLTSDDLEVEIGELIDQYTPHVGSGFGVLSIQRFTYNGSWEASIHLDSRFVSEHVEIWSGVPILRGHGADLYEALLSLRNRFLAAAPAEQVA